MRRYASRPPCGLNEPMAGGMAYRGREGMALGMLGF